MASWLWIIFFVVVSFGFVVLRGAPYVPTKRKPLQEALDNLYPLGENDVLVDIGSGDGIVLREAAKRGARAIGYELNPLLVLISRLLSRSPLITIRLGDYLYATLPEETTVIYTFGESRDIRRMYQKAEQTATLHGKHLYFLSFGFKVPGKKPVKDNGLFYLYKLKPLHRGKA